MKMGEKTAVRTPKQRRSIETSEKILETAYRLFCDKGYYNTTTNEIAREAGVPIGSLYAYFKDKDTIFMEILRRYHQTFVGFNAGLREKYTDFGTDKRAWLRYLIEELLRLHDNAREMQREMEILYHSKPEVAAILDEQRAETRKTALAYFESFREVMHTTDLEAAANVVFDTISGVVDRIIIGGYDIPKERIIDACVEMVYKYLML